VSDGVSDPNAGAPFDVEGAAVEGLERPPVAIARGRTSLDDEELLPLPPPPLGLDVVVTEADGALSVRLEAHNRQWWKVAVLGVALPLAVVQLTFGAPVLALGVVVAAVASFFRWLAPSTITVDQGRIRVTSSFHPWIDAPVAELTELTSGTIGGLLPTVFVIRHLHRVPLGPLFVSRSKRRWLAQALRRSLQAQRAAFAHLPPKPDGAAHALAYGIELPPEPPAPPTAPRPDGPLDLVTPGRCPWCVGVDLGEVFGHDERDCASCGGCLIGPAGVHHFVLEPIGLDAADLRELVAATSVKSRVGCAGCGGSTRCVRLKSVLVDLCPACGHVWLDRGERERLAAKSGRAP
jgi:hypothetical protein